MFEKAIHLALVAHDGQYRRDGVTPYIIHPIRVAARFEDDKRKTVAILHDVCEDTSFTLEDIKCLFPVDVYEAVDALTKREGEDYDDYIKRCSENELATDIKIQDIFDNATDASNSSLDKYYSALVYLSKGTIF